MTAEQTDAIVLRLIEFSETSFVVTLFTRDFGQVSAIAKGARRPKSPFEGALDLLAICRIMLIRKSHDQLDILTEAKLHRRFRAGQRELHRLYPGYYMIELLRELTETGDKQPAIFALAEEAQDALHWHEAPSALIARFEARMLRLTGHFPMLDRCVGCEQKVLTQTDRHSFSYVSGGIVCTNCRSEHRGFVSLSETARRIWSEYADHNDWSVPEAWNHAVCGELRGLANHWITQVLGHRLRMHDYSL